MGNLKVAGLDIGSHNLTIDETSGTLLVDGNEVSGSGGGGISYVWADESARLAQIGMSADEQGFQKDNYTVYKYTDSGWVDLYKTSPDGVVLTVELAALTDKLEAKGIETGKVLTSKGDGTSEWLEPTSGGDIALDDEILGKSLKTVNGNSLIGTGNIFLRGNDFIETKREGRNIIASFDADDLNKTTVLLDGVIPQNGDEFIFRGATKNKNIILSDEAVEGSDGYYEYQNIDAQIQDVFGDGSCTHLFTFNDTLSSADGNFMFKNLSNAVVTGNYIEGKYEKALVPTGLGGLTVTGVRPIVSSLSISVWVKPIKLTPNTSTDEFILTVSGIDLVFDRHGGFTVVRGTVTNQSAARSKKMIILDQWYLITLTCDSVNTKQLKMYINGELQTLVDYNNYDVGQRDLSISMAGKYGVRDLTTCYLDSLRLFNRALTEEEVGELYSLEDISIATIQHNMNEIPITVNKQNIVKNMRLPVYMSVDKAKDDGLLSGDMYVDTNGFIRMVME